MNAQFVHGLAFFTYYIVIFDHLRWFTSHSEVQWLRGCVFFRTCMKQNVTVNILLYAQRTETLHEGRGHPQIVICHGGKEAPEGMFSK